MYANTVKMNARKRLCQSSKEIYMKARENGITNLNEVEVIVLETTGDITIISKSESNNTCDETLKNVSGYPKVEVG